MNRIRRRERGEAGRGGAGRGREAISIFYRKSNLVLQGYLWSRIYRWSANYLDITIIGLIMPKNQLHK